MNTDLIYIQNYFDAKRNIHLDEFLDELNSSTLNKVLIPSLNAVKDHIYLIITTGLTENINPTDLMDNEVEVNNLLKQIFDSEQYARIDNKVLSSLYTDAFHKLCRRVFAKDGSNEEKYVLQSNVFNWLEDNLAKCVVLDKRFKDYDLIIKLLDQTELLHYFYRSFEKLIPIEWILDQEEQWITVDPDKRKVLDHITTFDKDYFKSYEYTIKQFENSSPWKYIYESTRYSDYALFIEEYSFRNAVLFEKQISLWLKYWDNLKLPLLQDIPFHYFKNPKALLKIAKELAANKDILSNPSHLGFILCKNFFDNCLAVGQNLARYDDEAQSNALSKSERDEEMLKIGKELLLEWPEKVRRQLYEQFFEAIIKVVTIKDLSEWVFSYSPKAFNRGNYDSIFNSELKILQEQYSTIAKTSSLQDQIKDAEKDFNLQKFVFLAEQIEKGINIEYIPPLISLFTNYIKSQAFYWDGSFSPAYWPTLKSIGKLLSLSEEAVEKAKRFISGVKVTHEGWKQSPIDYHVTQCESFAICGAILMLEHSEAFTNKEQQSSYFNYLLDFLLEQIRFSTINKDKDYKMPLVMLNLVVNQIHTDLKILFETKAVQEIDSIISVIEVLSMEIYILSAEAKILLAKRISSEFQYKKRKYLQRGQRLEIERIESLIPKLGIEI